jgi:hypothetical protein
MSGTHESSESEGSGATAPQAAHGAFPADGEAVGAPHTGASGDAGGTPPPPLPPGIAKLLSPRVTAAFAALMLAAGVAIGAAIGPAPTASFAGASRLVPLLPSLLGTTALSSPSAPAAAAASEPAPARRHRRRHKAPATAAAAPAETPPASSTPTETSPAGSTTPSTPLAPTSPSGATPTISPVTHVWLIELSGTGFGETLAQPAAAPYIDTQAVPSGTLLSGWSSIAAGTFAGDAALLASSPPQTVEEIVQPPCPEGPAGTACAAGTPGALQAADAFLKATLPAITASAPYREHGLVVVTFATVSSAAAGGLPGGAATATLTSQPPAGALLISPFATAGARPAGAFDPASPKQSIERLLRR